LLARGKYSSLLELGIDNSEGDSFMANIIGTIENDILNGGVFNDVIFGDEGDDIISDIGGNNDVNGAEGNDRITMGSETTGSGNDVINGGSGNDIIFDFGGNNNISGGDGNDRITTYGGVDIIRGGVGNDGIASGGGDDTVFGGSGSDTIDAGSGNDKVYGQAGADFVSGESGSDFLFGDAGNDRVIGGSGDDFQSGGAGNDTIRTHSGLFASGTPERDELYGGLGLDTFDILSNYLGGTMDPRATVDQSYAIVRDFSFAEGDRLNLSADPDSYIIEPGDFNGDGVFNDTFVILPFQKLIGDSIIVVNNLVAVVENTNAGALLASGVVNAFAP
jgi:Ca2+-binding RTX toxin-like protein